MSRVALDTVVLAALVDRRDKWHSLSVAIRDSVVALKAEIILLDSVVNEVVGVLTRRLQEQRRIGEIDVVLEALETEAPADQITWASLQTQRLYPQIMGLVRTHRGELNFHDALIALSCLELRIEYIVSFDRDFDRIPWLIRLDSLESVSNIT